MNINVNVKETLEKATKDDVIKAKSFVDEVKLITDGADLKEKEILRNIGLDEQIKIVEEATERSIRYNKAIEQFGTDFAIVNISVIEKMCMDYRLYFREASQYKGKIPNELGAILLRMNEKHNLLLDAAGSSGKNRMRILAIPEMFETYASPSKKIKGIRQQIADDYEAVKQSFQAVEKDPSLFFDTGDGVNFIHIKSWGNDFTIFRRIIGFFTETSFWINTLFTLLIPFLIFGAIKGIDLLFSAMITTGTNVLGETVKNITGINALIAIGGTVVIAVATIVALVFLSYTLGSGKQSFRTSQFATRRRWRG